MAKTISAMQILCADDEIKAVIDFSSAAKIPALWELMRSYMQSASDTKNPADFDAEKFQGYVRSYFMNLYQNVYIYISTSGATRWRGERVF